MSFATSARVAALPTFNFASGTYIVPLATQTTHSALGDGFLRLAPWYCPQPLTINRIGAEVTAAGQAGSKVRLGIYADNGAGQPGALALDAGQINGDSATVQEITLGSPLTLAKGWYWIGGAVQAAPTTLPTVRVSTPGIAPAPGFLVSAGTSLPVAGSAPTGYVQSGVSGALPATFTGTTVTNVSGPRLFLKLA